MDFVGIKSTHKFVGNSIGGRDFKGMTKRMLSVIRYQLSVNLGKYSISCFFHHGETEFIAVTEKKSLLGIVNHGI